MRRHPARSWLILFVAIMLALEQQAAALTPKEELIGYWRFKRGHGGPCARLIIDLEYEFRRDGTYYSRAEMHGMSRKLEYSGTYTATDTSTTAFVSGTRVGPYPYRIQGDILTIDQPEFGCQVVLEREDL